MTALTVPQALEYVFSQYHAEIAFVDKQAFRRQVWSYAEAEQRIGMMAAFLHSKGLQSGDHIAICAPNSPWWLMVYLACASLGIVIVPLDFNSGTEFIDSILAQTEAKLFKSAYKVYSGSVDTILLEDLAHVLPENALGHEFFPVIRPEDTLEIVFTSGSTGTPKGVVLTHMNVMSNVANFLSAWPEEGHQTSLSLVPLSHMLEQTAGFWSTFSLGYTIVYIASLRPTEIAAALRNEKITSIITVPAFLQLLRRRIQSQIDTTTFEGKFAQSLIRLAAKSPPRIARALTFPIRRRLGRQLETLGVGGAALPAEVEDFWTGMGYRIVQGYGLTETSPLATYSSRLHQKPRSVGKGLPNQELKVAENGELLLRGPHVFKGYYHNTEATDGVIDADGWLHTGDIAEIDQDGFVFLKGRMKNMLLGSNGLNIYPEDIEAKLLNFSIIRDAVVLMDNHGEEPQLTAVVLTTNNESEIDSVIKTVNQSLASHQTIQNKIIWPDSDFPRTPTRKVRRQIVQDAVDSRRTDEPFTPSLDTNLIHGILSQVSTTAKDIVDTMVLSSDLAIDSIKRLELVTLIEEKLLVVVDETDITQSTTVGELSELVEVRRRDAKQQAKQRIHSLSSNRIILFIQSLTQTLLLGFISVYQKLEAPEWKTGKEPVIYVSNHTSHLDAPTFMRLAGFRGRQQLVIAAAADYFFSNWLKAGFSRNILHAVPVEREGGVRQSLEQIGRELSLGRSVVIFPEGSRSLDGALHDFKPGVGLLAASLQVPVIPIKLTGNYEILPKGCRWPKRGRTHVAVGKPRTYSISQTPDDIAKDLKQAVEAL
jgi:long-chain acyl-CoA synthetase